MWESKLFLTSLHTTPLHWTIQNILLAANPSTAFLQKASWPGKNCGNVFPTLYHHYWIFFCCYIYIYIHLKTYVQPKDFALISKIMTRQKLGLCNCKQNMHVRPNTPNRTILFQHREEVQLSEEENVVELSKSTSFDYYQKKQRYIKRAHYAVIWWKCALNWLI